MKFLQSQLRAHLLPEVSENVTLEGELGPLKKSGKRWVRGYLGQLRLSLKKKKSHKVC